MKPRWSRGYLCCPASQDSVAQRVVQDLVASWERTQHDLDLLVYAVVQLPLFAACYWSGELQRPQAAPFDVVVG